MIGGWTHDKRARGRGSGREKKYYKKTLKKHKKTLKKHKKTLKKHKKNTIRRR